MHFKLEILVVCELWNVVELTEEPEQWSMDDGGVVSLGGKMWLAWRALLFCCDRQLL